VQATNGRTDKVVLALNKPQDPPIRRFVSFVDLAQMFGLIVCTTLLCFWLVPSMFDLSSRLKAEREAFDRKAAEEKGALRGTEGARAIYLRQQADLIEQQKRTKELQEQNARLAEELNRKLKGMMR